MTPNDYRFLLPSARPAYQETFRDIYGLDTAGLKFKDVPGYLSGYLLLSPMHASMSERTRIKLPQEPTRKPYRAHWLIYEDNLQICYCNGILHNKVLDNRHLMPKSHLLFNNERTYRQFSGEILFWVQQDEIPDRFLPFLNGSDLLEINVAEGKVTNIQPVFHSDGTYFGIPWYRCEIPKVEVVEKEEEAENESYNYPL